MPSGPRRHVGGGALLCYEDPGPCYRRRILPYVQGPAIRRLLYDDLVGRARRMLAAYENMAEMIRLGAYRKGANKEVDEAMNFYGPLEEFLRQGKDEKMDIPTGYAMLARILGVNWP